MQDSDSLVSASNQWARSFDILDCFLFLYYSCHDSCALPGRTGMTGAFILLAVGFHFSSTIFIIRSV